MKSKNELAFYSVAIRAFTMGEGYLCFTTYLIQGQFMHLVARANPEDHPVLPGINR